MTKHEFINYPSFNGAETSADDGLYVMIDGQVARFIDQDDLERWRQSGSEGQDRDATEDDADV